MGPFNEMEYDPENKRIVVDKLDLPPISHVPPEIEEELDRVFEEREKFDNPDAGRFFKKLTPTVRRQGPQLGDNVVLPKHYSRFQIEPIRFIGENNLNFFQGNIIKYILRHDAKNGLEDVRKAKRYCRMFELYLEGNPDWAGPDPLDKERTEVLEGIFEGFRQLAKEHLHNLPDTRAQILAGITLIESKYHGNSDRPA